MSSMSQVTADSESSDRKWRFSPLTNCQAAMFISAVVVYSILYLFFASHNYTIFLIMAGIICIFMVVLYTSGLLAVLVMILQFSKLQENFEQKPSGIAICDIKSSIVHIKY